MINMLVGGDVIGCGYIRWGSQLFFTHNGTYVGRSRCFCFCEVKNANSIETTKCIQSRPRKLCIVKRPYGL